MKHLKYMTRDFTNGDTLETNTRRFLSILDCCSTIYKCGENLRVFFDKNINVSKSTEKRHMMRVVVHK